MTTLTHELRQQIRQAWSDHERERLGVQADGLRHGVEKTYQNGCRCDECKRAARYARRRRRRAQAKAAA